MRLSTDPDTENSKDDALRGKGLDWRNRKTRLCGTRTQGGSTVSGVREVSSTWIVQDPIGHVENLYVSNYRGCDWTWIAFLIDNPSC